MTLDFHSRFAHVICDEFCTFSHQGADNIAIFLEAGVDKKEKNGFDEAQQRAEDDGER